MTYLPDVTKYQIDKARSISKQGDKNNLPYNKTNSNSRLPFGKVHHFISFISQRQFLHDVSFGEKKLKLSTGQYIAIPNVVRTLIGGRIISTYLAYCEEENFEPCGRSSLYKILSNCAASQRKNLTGLDNITADGISGFERLQKILDQLEDYISVNELNLKDIKKRVVAGQRYLSHNYRWHILKSSDISDHCINYALSDAEELGASPDLINPCNHPHETACQQCTDLTTLIDDIGQIIIDTSLPGSDLKAELLYDFQCATNHVCQWKNHIIRTVNQEFAKENTIENLAENEVIIIMDWAMKFIPIKDREKQIDFYGKKGISWHISVVISKSSDKDLETKCYVHLFNNVKQDWFAVASIIEGLLNVLKNENENLQTVFLRSDNAGCYHCNNLIGMIPYISKRTGVNIYRYDFSEVQSGKDICDRRTAPLKIHAIRYSNEGHDISCAQELKTALESYGGIESTKVYLCEIENKSKRNKIINLENISLYSNFQFEEDGIRLWKSYGIGSGKLVEIKMEDIMEHSSGLCIMEYPVNNQHRLLNGKRKGNKRKRKITMEADTIENDNSSTETEKENLYHCHECGVKFSSLRDWNTHLDIGKHPLVWSDRVKVLWQEKCVGVKRSLRTNTTYHPSTSESDLSRGWALKSKRQSKRFSEAVKSYVKALFLEGENTGRKYTPTEVSKKIRNARDSKGDKIFSSSDWLSSQQVQGLFSKYSAQKTIPQNTNIDEEELDVALDQVYQLEEYQAKVICSISQQV